MEKKKKETRWKRKIERKGKRQSLNKQAIETYYSRLALSRNEK